MSNPVRYLYLIGDKAKTFCKVGHSRNPEKRLRALQTGCPLRLCVLEQIEIPQWRKSTSTLVSAKLYEDEVLRLLRKAGLGAEGGSEWFHYVPGILKCAIESMPISGLKLGRLRAKYFDTKWEKPGVKPFIVEQSSGR